METDLTTLIKGSFSKFLLKRNDVVYNTSSKIDYCINSIELMPHTAGLPDAYVFDIHYHTDDAECQFYISPVTTNSGPQGALVFTKYATSNPTPPRNNIARNNNSRKYILVPIVEFSIEEFKELKTLFETEFEARKKQYTVELEETKTKLFHNWKRDITV